jgi:hypothetical protein
MALDAGEHDAAQVGLQQTVRLTDGIIESSAFFEFIPIHVRLIEEVGGGFGAFASDRIQFKNEPGRAADRKFNVSSRRILHAVILAPRASTRHSAGR